MIAFLIFFCRVLQSPIHAIKSAEEGFALYKIAFQWYPLLGVISMWIPAMIISYLTGGQDFTNFNVQLLSPCVQKLVPRKYRHRELKVVSSNNEPPITYEAKN